MKENNWRKPKNYWKEVLRKIKNDLKNVLDNQNDEYKFRTIKFQIPPIKGVLKSPTFEQGIVWLNYRRQLEAAVKRNGEMDGPGISDFINFDSER